MSEPLLFVDVSEIVPGKLEEAKAAFQELAEFVEANESRVISYNVFFNADETLVTVTQVHPDAASMEYHVEVGADLFRRFGGLLTMRTMVVYGEPSEALLEAMRAKAVMLGAAGLEVHTHHTGFSRVNGP